MKYFCFDAETNGLYGEVFAIAAVVVDEQGTILDQFCLKSEEQNVTDEWTRKNCVPYLADIPECENRDKLRELFWAFYMQYKDCCTIVADVPYPVEAQLLRSCVEKYPEERTFQGPFPLIDVASVLFAHGIDPLVDRLEFAGMKGKRHHPLDDALASVLCLIKALKKESIDCNRL